VRGKRNLTWSRAVARYLIESRVERGMTKRTLDSYEKVLGYWADGLTRSVGMTLEEIDPRDVEQDDLLDVLSTWTRLSNASLANRISVAHSFFDWLSRRYSCEDVSARIKRPRKERPARRRLEQRDVEALIAAPISERDRLIVWLLAFTGIRRAELSALRWRDADLDERVLRIVRGKGGKGREVPIPPPLASLLRDVRAQLSEHGRAEPEHYLACRRRELQDGRVRVEPSLPMGDATPNKIIVRAARAAGISDAEHVGPHDLRRAYATAFQHANPGDLMRLQAAMGHADLSTTRLYVADAEQRSMRDAADRAFAVFALPIDSLLVRVANTSPARMRNRLLLRGLVEAAGIEPAVLHLRLALRRISNPSTTS
jgi:integrase